jgi:hypothetical protein
VAGSAVPRILLKIPMPDGRSAGVEAACRRPPDPGVASLSDGRFPCQRTT